MLPGFTADRATAVTRGHYRGSGRSTIATAGTEVPAVHRAAVQGAYGGTWCMGGVITVVTVDRDDEGRVTGWHNVDEIGSCEPSDGSFPM
ncbi:hypothetical protein [Kitasatospora sp. NPDC051705]|uniref:hypothetical protein n=1 Tax=Kitasatospora sp. NPDC051705 TaxID=3364057 RepID=UPI0037AE0A9C